MRSNSLKHNKPHARVTASPLSLEERATRASQSMGNKRLTYLSQWILETKIGDEISALVLDCVRAFHALERLFGVFIAECRGSFVIGLGGARFLRSAAAFLGER